MSLATEPPTIGHPDEKVRTTMPRLGEELPIFCERCGYSLHGLPQTTCAQCAILQFHCPECGHHQPINTLRPAVQNILGRVRAVALIGSVVGKLAFFVILSFAWFAMGVEWTYRYNEGAYRQSSGGYTQTGPRLSPITFQDIDVERLVAFAIFAFLFGCVARMLLLRWRRSPIVGAVLAGIVLIAITLGASAQYWDSLDNPYPLAPPYTSGLLFLLAYTAAIIITAATVVWPIWCGLVKAFLPRRAAGALLDWQRSMSNPDSPTHTRSILARDAPHRSDR